MPICNACGKQQGLQYHMKHRGRMVCTTLSPQPTADDHLKGLDEMEIMCVGFNGSGGVTIRWPVSYFERSREEK